MPAELLLDEARLSPLVESNEQLERIHAPAGLDLGHLSPEEIGVAILAELVQLRAAGKLVSMPETDAAAPSEVHEAIDPVCGMTVMVATARHISTFQGKTYYFCAPGCRNAFEADPAGYVAAS